MLKSPILDEYKLVVLCKLYLKRALDVQDCYVDAFNGRVPQSILARHYTDYSPKLANARANQRDLLIVSKSE